MACYPRIRKLRKEADMTQETLAACLGIHRTTYNRYERGICDPPASFLYDLADFYNLSSDYILGLANTPMPLKRNSKPGS